jgi:hypothetical protein
VPQRESADKDLCTVDENGHSTIGQDKPVPRGLENTAEPACVAVTRRA